MGLFNPELLFLLLGLTGPELGSTIQLHLLKVLVFELLLDALFIRHLHRAKVLVRVIDLQLGRMVRQDRPHVPLHRPHINFLCHLQRPIQQSLLVGR